MNTTAPNQNTHPNDLICLQGSVGITQLSTFHFNLPTLAMATQPQIKPPIPMILSAYKALILPAYKAALQMSRYRYICRENATNHPFLCKTNPIFSEAKSMQPYSPQGITIINRPARLEKTNPKQTQTNPILLRTKRMQPSFPQRIMKINHPSGPRQNKPNSNPNKANFPFPKAPTPPNYPPLAIRNLALSDLW